MKKTIAKRNILLAGLLFIILFTISTVIRKPFDSAGFSMSDATYHVLLTMQAYDETPSSVHHWLPIQTYGQDFDKFIDNGPSLLQDEAGNSYYVSFSPIGFYMPYFFCKAFHLGLTVKGIYIFNSLLMLISSLLVAYILYIIFKNPYIAFISAIIYCFMPEIMYTQGIVYWNHSLSQVLLLLQILLFTCLTLENKRRKIYWVMFYIISFLYPYSEWTGFISNVGMAIGLFIYDIIIYKDSDGRKRLAVSLESIVEVELLAIVTVGALCYYIFRFSSIASPNEIISTMTSRAEARSNASILALLNGYKLSFSPLLILIAVLLILILICKESRKELKVIVLQKRFCCIFVIALFPLLENVIMMQHAISYTFDRLKMVVVLLFILCCCMEAVKIVSSKLAIILSIISTCSIFVLGITNYGNSKIIDMEQYNDRSVPIKCGYTFNSKS